MNKSNLHKRNQNIFMSRISIKNPLKLILLFFCAILLFAIESSYAATPQLFGSKEVRSIRLKPFPKWTELLTRYEGDELLLPPIACNLKNQLQCRVNKWQDFLTELRGKDTINLLNSINHYMNQKTYIIDPINWGRPDYWSTPRQFFAKEGDCEDYAIAKYMSLRKIGVPAEKLRIVVLKDENLDIMHAVLAVYTDDSKIYILDNQIAQILEDKNIYHYTPIYSINEEHWWRHRY